MTAEIISIGTELLMGQIVDTHAATLGRILPEFGIAHYHRQTVGDNLERVADAIDLALGRADLVFTIGGLGPTEDDLTREAIAEATGLALVQDEALSQALKDLFASRGIPWVDSQLRQAMRPEGSKVIPNPNGSAPGLIVPLVGKTVVALPGPKGEFGPMVEGPVRELLTQLAGSTVLVSRTFKVAAMGESMVEEAIRDLIHGDHPTVGIYAHPGDVHLRLSAMAETREAALGCLEPVAMEIAARLAGHVYGEDEDTLESVVLDLLRKRGQTLATAESCTGGWIGQRLTSVPGSADVYVGGVISYSNEVKQELLGVPKAILQSVGAVSRDTAEAMATGAREHVHADWAVSVTGIAGPGGGTEAKPVGLVYVGCAGPAGVEHREFHFRGTREFIRQRSVQAALTLLWQQIRS